MLLPFCTSVRCSADAITDSALTGGWRCDRRAALTNMSNVKRFIATSKIENMRMPLKDEGIRMWRSVAEALQLSREQYQSTSQLWSSFRQGAAPCASSQ